MWCCTLGKRYPDFEHEDRDEFLTCLRKPVERSGRTVITMSRDRLIAEVLMLNAFGMNTMYR